MVRCGPALLKLENMENQLIEIQDLQVGDEIMISCQSYFKYLKVLTPPALSKTKVHWSTKQPLYSNVRCTAKQNVITNTYTWNGNSYTRTTKVWGVSPEDHNMRISQDLNERQIWLVKRETI
jgi:glutathione peroxidase-family protein